jgi:transposase
MPWRATDVRKARNEFVILADKGIGSFAKLCRSAGISRITGYRWLDRYRRLANINDLVELNRRPHSSPNKTSPDIENKVLEMRDRFGWGPRKLSASLKEERVLLAPSTVYRILRSHRRIRMVRTDSAAWMIRILLANNSLGVLEQEPPRIVQNSRLGRDLNPGLLCVTRTKTRFQPEFGPNMQESCFGGRFRFYLAPGNWRRKSLVEVPGSRPASLILLLTD